MKFSVNDNCIGCSLCCECCPEILEMSENGNAKAKNEDVDGKLKEKAVEAEENCPVYAIEHK